MGAQEDVVAAKAAGFHYKWAFIKSYKTNYPFPEHRAQGEDQLFLQTVLLLRQNKI